MDVQLYLLGPPRLEVSGDPAGTRRLGAKPLALLAFLAVEGGVHTRDELATLLWTDSPDEAARASLRQALRHLRRVCPGAVRADRQAARVDPNLRCDVRTFFEGARADPVAAATTRTDRFLAGLTVRRAPGFDEWVDGVRARLRAARRDALRTAAERAMSTSHWREATGFALEWIALEPLAEEPVRCAVEACYLAGRRNDALACYERHRAALLRETGREPGTPLRRLIERVRSGGHVEPIPSPPSAGDLPAFHAAMVGREPQWRSLTETWHAVRAGATRVVLIEGEPGIGKTRLAEELRAWLVAQGATVLAGQGYDTEVGVPYLPVVDALRRGIDAPGLAAAAPEWLAELARILPAIRERFPRLPDPSLPSDSDRRGRLFESVAQALLALSSERPTALLLDDLQQWDEGTCALVHFLTRRLERAPLLLVALARLGESRRGSPAARLCRAVRGAPRAATLSLAPLTEGQVWTLIRDLGRIADPNGARRFAHQVHSVTDGNPFHTLELLKALFAQDMLTVDAASGEWMATRAVGSGNYHRIRMPPTVRDAVAERCGHLAYELRDLLAVAAVARHPVTSRLLSRVHGASRLRAAALADALVDRLLLAETDGRYRCAHPIIQDVVREDLTPARRRELHRAVAIALDALAQEGHHEAAPGEIARHAERGGEVDLAYRWALAAADEALGNAGHEEALGWLELAARVTESPEHAATANAGVADVMRRAGWHTLPPRRRPGTPVAGFAKRDLDLRTP